MAPTSWSRWMSSWLTPWHWTVVSIGAEVLFTRPAFVYRIRDIWQAGPPEEVDPIVWYVRVHLNCNITAGAVAQFYILENEEIIPGNCSQVPLKRSNMVRYCINNWRNWARTLIRSWTHGRAMWCLLLIFDKIDRVLVSTHWGRDKMAAFSQTTLWNEFSWMKMLEFRLTFLWSLFIRVLLTIFQHWFW